MKIRINNALFEKIFKNPFLILQSSKSNRVSSFVDKLKNVIPLLLDA